MPTRILFALAAAAALTLFAAHAQADDDAVTVKLWRPVSVGEKYALAAKVDEHIKTKLQTQGTVKTDDKTNKYVLDAVMEVKATDKKGVETAARLTIKSLQQTAQDEDPAELVPAGTQVDVAFVDNHYTYQAAAGAALSPQVQQALARTFPRTIEKTIDDDSFGATGKKKVGDTWLVDPKALLQNITIDQASASSEKVAAIGKLAAIENFYNADWLSVQVTLQATEITGTDSLKVKEGTVNIEFNGLYPRNTAIKKQTAASKIQIHMLADIVPTADAPAKRTVTIDAETRTSQSQILVK